MKKIDEQAWDKQLDAVAFKRLFKTNPFRHGAAVLLNWGLIFIGIFAAEYFQSPFSYVGAVILIGARMHGLGILVHEAAHYRFLKNRYWNDLLTNLTATYFIFTTVDTYRKNHLAHHQHLNSDNDPDWVAKLGKGAYTFPKSRLEFLLRVLSYLFLYQGILDAFWFLKRFGGKKKATDPAKDNKWIQLGFNAILFTALTVFGGWKYYLLYWIVPYLSTFFMFQYIRSVAEHFGDLAYEHDLNSTRSVKPNWLESFFIAPHNVGYHLEHHLYPGVPFYHLPELHRMLMELPDYSSAAHITQGYTTGLLNELGAQKTAAT